MDFTLNYVVFLPYSYCIEILWIFSNIFASTLRCFLVQHSSIEKKEHGSWRIAINVSRLSFPLQFIRCYFFYSTTPPAFLQQTFTLSCSLSHELLLCQRVRIREMGGLDYRRNTNSFQNIFTIFIIIKDKAKNEAKKVFYHKLCRHNFSCWNETESKKEGFLITMKKCKWHVMVNVDLVEGFFGSFEVMKKKLKGIFFL